MQSTRLGAILSDPNNSMTYIAFILGRTPLMSIAELAALLPDEFADSVVVDKEFCIIEKKHDTAHYIKLLARLGGTIKIIEGDIVPPTQAIISLEARIDEILKKHEGKFLFAVNQYGHPKFVRKLDRKKILKALKAYVSAKGFSVRFVHKDLAENVAVPVLVHNHVMTKGIDANTLFLDFDNVFVGATVAIQDIEAYTKRDAYRPARDMKRGLMPPKLAQVVVNIASRSITSEKNALLDPFCGAGGILVEGALMGHTMYGSDVDSAAVKDAKDNVAYAVPVEMREHVEIHAEEARSIKSVPPAVAAIASEGFLGPILHRPYEGMSIPYEEVQKVYVDFFSNLVRSKILLPVCITFPFYMDKRGKRLYCDTAIKKIEDLGYRRESLVDESANPLGSEELDQIDYIRTSQHVGRMITYWLPPEIKD